ncbi:MAG: hypothetical protein KDA28_08860, partial [Phycisphaerales bacterium]|nr:hypothetical protein [Phycisphaerales bacterium]
DISLQRPGIMPVVRLAEGAQRTMRVIRRGIVASLAYNLVAVGLAVAGLIHPIVAAGLMPLSSLTVLTIATRSRTFGKE